MEKGEKNQEKKGTRFYLVLHSHRKNIELELR
jgi:hypothetical protein